jgi:acyl-CoA thioesterase-1
MQNVFVGWRKKGALSTCVSPASLVLLLAAGGALAESSVAGHAARPAMTTATRGNMAADTSTTTSAAAARPDHSASKTVLVLGDSLSAEYGLTRGAGWVPLLQQRLAQRHLSAPIVNASISGETTSGGRSRLPALLAQHHPDIVLIELGGNDALRGLALNATEANLREMVRAAEKTGAQVMLLGMQIPPNYGPAYARQFAAIYPKLARETGSVLVPFFLEGLQTRPDLFQADRIHPVAAAQPMLLDNVWPFLAPLIEKTNTSDTARHGTKGNVKDSAKENSGAGNHGAALSRQMHLRQAA